MMVGAAISERGVYEPRETGDVVLALDHYSGPGFEDISFEVARGQVVGLTGLMGCGSTELMQCLFGIERPQGGSATIRGKRLHGGSIHEAMKGRHCHASLRPQRELGSAGYVALGKHVPVRAGALGQELP